MCSRSRGKAISSRNIIAINIRRSEVDLHSYFTLTTTINIRTRKICREEIISSSFSRRLIIDVKSVLLELRVIIQPEPEKICFLFHKDMDLKSRYTSSLWIAKKNQKQNKNYKI